jgi:uncharacterized protein (TIGR02300 family)
VAKTELGTKRQCHSCGNRFYDLNRDPIPCPKCGAVFQLNQTHPVAPAAAAVVVDDEVKAEPVAGPELVSLEEADADAAVVSKVLDGEEEVEATEATTADETFLEEEEEGDDDVAALIDGDIEDDEEA